MALCGKCKQVDVQTPLRKKLRSLERMDGTAFPLRDSVELVICDICKVHTLALISEADSSAIGDQSVSVQSLGVSDIRT